MVLCARLACAQEFFLHQSQYYHGEEIFFDLWLSKQDSFSYVYVVLLAPIDQRPLDHHPYLNSHGLTQGRFLPDFKDLPTGPYLVAAIGDKGSFLGAIPIFMTRYTERYWYANSVGRTYPW
jgi:hypothetical protein